MIRRITPADCDAIAALEARLFATALDQARLMALQSNPVFCGFVDLVPDQDQPQSISAGDLAPYLDGYLLATMIDVKLKSCQLALRLTGKDRVLANGFCSIFLSMAPARI